MHSLLDQAGPSSSLSMNKGLSHVEPTFLNVDPIHAQKGRHDTSTQMILESRTKFLLQE